MLHYLSPKKSYVVAEGKKCYGKQKRLSELNWKKLDQKVKQNIKSGIEKQTQYVY
jgi:hypothetical protein